MTGEPTAKYVTATIVAAVGAVVGVWLPWVRKRPVGYSDGLPLYTLEIVPGLETGLRGMDLLVILLVMAVVAVVVLARYRGWRPDSVLIGAGGLILLVFANLFRTYSAVERYAVEPGLYLLIASGGLFVLIGTSSLLKRCVPTVADESGEPRIE